MHPVINESEHRVRAGIRIVVYIILAFPIVILGNSFSLGGYEFIFTGLLSFGFFWVMYRFIDHRASIDIAGLKPEKIWFKECSLGVLIAAFVMGLIFGVQVLVDTVKVVGFSWNQPGTSSWISPLKERKLIVAGSKKMIVFDDMKSSEKLMIYDKGVNVIRNEDIEYGEYEIKTRDGDVWIPYIEHEDALFNSLEAFRSAVKNGTDIITCPNQAIRIQKILEKADKAIK